MHMIFILFKKSHIFTRVNFDIFILTFLHSCFSFSSDIAVLLSGPVIALVCLGMC